MKSKMCTRCKQTLSLDDFSTKTRASDGKQSQCRNCLKELNMNAMNKKEQIKERVKLEIKSVVREGLPFNPTNILNQF